MTESSKHLCPAQLCGREYTLTATGRIRRHSSRTDPEQSCPGGGHPPAGSAQAVAEQQERTAREWDKVLSQGEKKGEDVSGARATFVRAIEQWSPPEMVACPEGMSASEFEDAAGAWLSKQLGEAREKKGEALSLEEIGALRRQRYHAVAQDARIRAAADIAPGSDNPMYGDLQERAMALSDLPPWANPVTEVASIRREADALAELRVLNPELTPPPWLAAVPEQRPAPVVEQLPPPPWSAPEAEGKPQPPDPADLFAESGRAARPAQMTDLGAEITARFKELFFSYVNRDSADNRGAQAHMGPSEIGTPCDRRIALTLMRVPACNPGGDSWASFRGTAVHAELAKMFEWANHGTGRFATEVGLEFPVALMPRGTTDLIDRTLMLVLDHKVQGAASATELREQGPPPHYRVQAHVYAHGARLKGEEIEHVAITSWPGDRSTLKNLYTWTEAYDESIALAAIARVEGISEKITRAGFVRGVLGPAGPTPLEIGRLFPTANACKFCRYHAPGDKRQERGCQGYDK